MDEMSPLKCTQEKQLSQQILMPAKMQVREQKNKSQDQSDEEVLVATCHTQNYISKANTYRVLCVEMSN